MVFKLRLFLQKVVHEKEEKTSQLLLCVDTQHSSDELDWNFRRRFSFTLTSDRACEACCNRYKHRHRRTKQNQNKTAQKMSAKQDLFACLLCVCLAFGGTLAQDLKAECEFEASTGDPDYPITGTVTFTQEDGSQDVEVQLDIRGFNITDAQTVHGFHVHESGNMGNGCMDAGGHFNPEDVDHGPRTADITGRHVGDLGNIDESPDSPELSLTFTDSIIQLSGNHSIMGRAIVIHANADDLGEGGDDESKRTGNAGARLACCLIRESASSENSPLTAFTLITAAFITLATTALH